MEKLKRTIKALSLGKLEEGSIGFITKEDEDKWYNIHAETDILKQLIKDVIQKGSIVEFNFNNGVVAEITQLEKPTTEKSWGDDMTNFEDLLSAAHDKFGDKFSIKTELISVDIESKLALFSACVSVEYEPGKITLFTAHGDAEGIGSDMIKPHFIRMAETRAISRALRWATNNAQVSK